MSAHARKDCPICHGAGIVTTAPLSARVPFTSIGCPGCVADYWRKRLARIASRRVKSSHAARRA